MSQQRASLGNEHHVKNGVSFSLKNGAPKQRNPRLKVRRRVALFDGFKVVEGVNIPLKIKEHIYKLNKYRYVNKYMNSMNVHSAPKTDPK